MQPVESVSARLSISSNLRPQGFLRIPVESAQSVEMRYALLSARDRFNPRTWSTLTMQPSTQQAGCFDLDLNSMELEDGVYEYEYILDGHDDRPIPDPFAEEITRFGGYRGVFRIKNHKLWDLPFSWEDEFPTAVSLQPNRELVIYEMPVRWMNMPPGASQLRQVGLGTFDKVVFEHLDYLCTLGINAIELLPVQDSTDTLNWGYGTRFFFTPDYDMGSPTDLKFLIKSCHQRGIRVILDVVMNHARDCPLAQLADSWFFLRDRNEEPGRGEDYGARLFRYRDSVPEGQYWGREFHYRMADFWVRNYRIDGFRIDEFKGIDNWEFVQAFSERAHAAQSDHAIPRPFIVIAEHSARDARIVKAKSTHPHGRKIVDSMWNFAFRDDLRRLMRNELYTQWGQPSRRDRIMALVTGRPMWDEYAHAFREGFDDIVQTVNYITSHDVEQNNEQRFLNDVFSQILQQRGLGDGSVDNIRNLVDAIEYQSYEIQQAHADALMRVRSAFALLLTSVGIPMFLAGEEFGDCHDLPHSDWQYKMSDPVDWQRQYRAGHVQLRQMIQEFINCRRTMSALSRNETSFFYFHPDIDSNDGPRVFAYCRSRGQGLGAERQVIVVANCGPHHFNEFWLPWHWPYQGLLEYAQPDPSAHIYVDEVSHQARLALAPFQVRVFSSQ